MPTSYSLRLGIILMEHSFEKRLNSHRYGKSYNSSNLSLFLVGILQFSKFRDGIWRFSYSILYTFHPVFSTSIHALRLENLLMF